MGEYPKNSGYLYEETDTQAITVLKEQVSELRKSEATLRSSQARVIFYGCILSIFTGLWGYHLGSNTTGDSIGVCLSGQDTGVTATLDDNSTNYDPGNDPARMIGFASWAFDGVDDVGDITCRSQSSEADSQAKEAIVFNTDGLVVKVEYNKFTEEEQRSTIPTSLNQR